jgi:hypothetical protein
MYAWDKDLDGLYGLDDNGEPTGDFVEYIGANWQVGTERIICLIVCDANFRDDRPVIHADNCGVCS